MEAVIFERIRNGLLQKRERLTEWLHSTPSDKKEVLLGPSTEQSVLCCVDVIEEAIAKADSKTLGKCEVCHEDVDTELLEVDYTACVCLEHLSEEERRHLESELNWPRMCRRCYYHRKHQIYLGLRLLHLADLLKSWGETTLISLILEMDFMVWS